jgi:hypothetical protein
VDGEVKADGKDKELDYGFGADIFQASTFFERISACAAIYCLLKTLERAWIQAPGF